VPDENLLIFELVRDFLHYNRLTSTLSVFTSETGAPSLPLDRAELAVLVGVTDDAHSVQLCVARAAHRARWQADASVFGVRRCPA
jgi:hypothetical protein